MLSYPKLTFVSLCLAASGLFSKPDLPNIVIIMADDYGYGSSNCYGADPKFVRTPNINQLAEEGMRFTDANTPASVCSPTRYAMLTGRYAWRGKMKYGVLMPPEGPLVIEDDIFTLPEYLQSVGYRTAHIGKWHLGYTNLDIVEDLSAQPLEPGPRSMGFDYHFAVPNNLDWLPKVYVENEGIVGLRSKGKTPYGVSSYKGQQYHGYDAPQRVTEKVTGEITDVAAKWIKQTVVGFPDQPFFLYFAQVAVHIPIVTSEESKGTSGVGVYGDFIHDLDLSVGGIVTALEEAGVMDDTIVIFTSDNGGDHCAEAKEAMAMGFRNNGDLKGDKHLIWEGGFKVPLIVTWPGHIKAASVTDRMVNTVDIYSTLQELIEGDVLSAESVAPDSFSFYQTLVSDERGEERKTMIINDVKGVHAIRMGGWKYVENNPLRPNEVKRKLKNPKLYQPELYNLESDPSETTNVIKAHPEIAQQMQETLNRIRSMGSERMALSN